MDQKITDLLLDCLHQDAGRVTPDRLASLTREEWQLLLTFATQQRVSGLLYHRLKSRGWEAALPEETLQALQQVCLRNAARNLGFYGELKRIVSALHAGDIPVVVLKGAHLAGVVYGNLALREMGDIDLLVRQTSLARAAGELQKAGYRPARPFWIEAICATSQHLPKFTKPGAATIELHWTIAYPTSPITVDLDGLWERARLAAIDGIEVLTLCPEDLLLHLCLHTSFQHRFTIGLRALCDISETVRYYRDDLDWEQVQVRARRWGAGRCAYLTLRLARELVGAGVPADVLSALEPDDLDPGFVTWARDRLLTHRGRTLPLSSNLVRIWEADGLRGKVANFLKFTFPSRETMAAMYPASPSSKRIYLYYPVRLVDVLLRYTRTAWRLLRRDEATIALSERQDRGNALVDWLGSP